MDLHYLESVRKQFEYYKMAGERAMAQLNEEQLFYQYNEESNSIGIIVKHLWGNMMSRWTNFLNSDGEKDWRKRDEEFDNDIKTREELMKKWEQGWSCFFNALYTLSEEDLGKEIFIRNQGHTVMDAINRQLAHYPYHIGQIVYIAKMHCMNDWHSLSIPRGESKKFNENKFSMPKGGRHFTDDFLK